MSRESSVIWFKSSIVSISIKSTLAILLVYIVAYFTIFNDGLIQSQVKKSLDRKEKVLVVFSVSPRQCDKPIGESIYIESYLNKQRFAQIQGYDLLYNRRQPDPNITGNYNKVALLREILRNESSLEVEKRHDWIFWLDYDTIIRKLDHRIDFARYKDHDIVMWGIPLLVDLLGDGLSSINFGSFLLRNSDWSLRLMERLCEFGLDNGQAHEPEMRRVLYNYNRVLYEQNAMVYLLKTDPDIRNRAFFEYSNSINWFWRLFPIMDPFVVHFAGCQFCWYDSNPNCIKFWRFYLRESNRTYFNLKPTNILL